MSYRTLVPKEKRQKEAAEIGVGGKGRCSNEGEERIISSDAEHLEIYFERTSEVICYHLILKRVQFQPNMWMLLSISCIQMIPRDLQHCRVCFLLQKELINESRLLIVKPCCFQGWITEMLRRFSFRGWEEKTQASSSNSCVSSCSLLN